MDDSITVGHIAGLFGTRGWLKVQSYTRPRENLLGYSPWRLRLHGVWTEFKLNTGRRHHGGLIVCLTGISDREAAAALLRAEIGIERSQLAPTGPGEYYWSDLIGLSAVNQDGVALGTVKDLLETGAHDVLCLAGERERLIPFVNGVYVKGVDLESGLIHLNWHVDD